MQSPEAVLEKKTMSLALFLQEVSDAVQKHAARKNYHAGEVEGPQPLLDFKKALGIARGHHMGEITHKLAEYMRTPRRVILVKIAGWCYVEWRDCQEE